MAKKTVVIMPRTREILAQMGEQIHLARLRRKLTLELVAERAGISHATLVSIEKGASTVSIGAYAAAMNGLDAVIFTGGIGENAPNCREEVCENMEYLGIKIDKDVNNFKGELKKISTPDSKVEVWVIPTNEELLIARDTLAMIQK